MFLYSPLANNGSYPGDSGYALFEDTIITLTGVSKQAKQSPPPEWFDAIPGGAETPPPIVWIGAVGDIMVGRGVPQLLQRSGGTKLVFTNTLSTLRRFDFLMGNLEGAVTNRGVRADKSYTFRFQPWTLDSLSEAGFNYLSVANNHSFDFGEPGFIDTIKHLRERGFLTSGAGMTRAEAAKASVIDLEGEELRVLSLGAYPNPNKSEPKRSERKPMTIDGADKAMARSSF